MVYTAVAAYLISSATCGAITADQLQAQARAGTRFNLASAIGASTPNHAWNVAFCPPREVIRRTGRTALRPLCSVRRPIRLSAASFESFRAFAFCFADRRADAHPPDEVTRLQSRNSLTCPPFSEATPEDLAGFTADFLREELVRRNLDATGPKEEVLNRLLADIAQNRSTTPLLPSPDSSAPSQRPNTTPLPSSFDAAQSTDGTLIATPSPKEPTQALEGLFSLAVKPPSSAPFLDQWDLVKQRGAGCERPRARSTPGPSEGRDSFQSRSRHRRGRHVFIMFE
ncbi:hypothetical protein HPB52_016351 [Rhipicephalus sanguineus]|uniref:SAP domain-containing protein n=1 Tax=Rhipicephalus sanguineus TaxID=34632 RepID=A0A9D4PX06_RHISA|nr:hypothetical protein HPB52_016351 [Rhipicephalus sanguineus]